MANFLTQEEIDILAGIYNKKSDIKEIIKSEIVSTIECLLCINVKSIDIRDNSETVIGASYRYHLK